MLLLVSRDSPVTSHLWPDSVTETQRPGDSSNSLRGSKLPECPVPSLGSRDTTLSPYWRRRGRDTDLSVHTLHGTTWHIAPSQTRHSIDTGDPSAGVLQHPGEQCHDMSTVTPGTGSVTLLYSGVFYGYWYSGRQLKLINI